MTAPQHSRNTLTPEREKPPAPITHKERYAMSMLKFTLKVIIATVLIIFTVLGLLFTCGVIIPHINT